MRFVIGSLLTATLGLSSLACGSKTLSPQAARVREGMDLDLADCAFVQKVRGTASEGDSNAVVHAKNRAREEAAALGATHVRWIVPCCTEVEGEAYRCDAPD
jgi:hypothetical protein